MGTKIRVLLAFLAFALAIVFVYASVGSAGILQSLGAPFGTELAEMFDSKSNAMLASALVALAFFVIGATLLPQTVIPEPEEEPRYSDDDSPDDGFNDFPHNLEEEVTSEEERK